MCELRTAQQGIPISTCCVLQLQPEIERGRFRERHPGPPCGHRFHAIAHRFVAGLTLNTPGPEVFMRPVQRDEDRRNHRCDPYVDDAAGEAGQANRFPPQHCLQTEVARARQERKRKPQIANKFREIVSARVLLLQRTHYGELCQRPLLHWPARRKQPLHNARLEPQP
jgi:hypothetical protein